jgi:hypothetical protein
MELVRVFQLVDSWV